MTSFIIEVAAYLLWTLAGAVMLLVTVEVALADDAPRPTVRDGVGGTLLLLTAIGAYLCWVLQIGV